MRIMKLLLQDQELWQKFREHQTEMMITNSGRRMCPLMSIAFEDLKPRRFYAVMVDFVLMDAFRYSYDATCNRWEAHTRILPEENWPRLYVHPSTPATGASLMQNVLTFKTLKLTNCPVTAANTTQAILLTTMRRYIPRIQVVESADGVHFDYNLRKEFYFQETEFMAVSQYRNKQIAQLKIDANPFAKAFRSDGMHGKAKRRRLETLTACEYWKTPEYGLPSNCSSMEASLVNSDRPDVGNNSCSNVLGDELSSEESFNNDERQVNGTRANSASQTGLCKDVLDVQNKTRNGTNNHESPSIASQATQHQSTNPPSQNDSDLMCEESTEWMWGFDEQMSLRYASNGQLEGLFKYGDSLENSSKNFTDANEVAKVTVNRRKKYLPRRLQRTVTSTNVSSEGIMESEPADKLAFDQINLPSQQPNEKTSISGDDGKAEQSCSTEEQTTRSTASPCCEPVAKPSISCNNSLHSQRRNSHTDDMLSKFCAATEEISVSGQDGSHSTCSVSDESLATSGSSTLLTATPGPGNTTGSSLTALMQMCSDAESGLDNRRSMRQRGTVTGDISGTLEMPDKPGTKDIFPGELAEARMSSSKESAGTVTSLDYDSLFKRQMETSTTSSCHQLSQETGNSYSVSMTSEGEEWARPSLVPISSGCSGHVTSSNITETSAAFNNSSNSGSHSMSSFVSATSSNITSVPLVFNNSSNNCSSNSSETSMNSFTHATSSDKAATSPVVNNSINSASQSMNSFVSPTSSNITAMLLVFNDSSSGNSSIMNSSLSVTSSDISATPTVSSNCNNSGSHSMNSAKRVASSDTPGTPLVVNVCSNSNRAGTNSSVSDTVRKSPTTTYPCQTAGSTAVSRVYTCIEESSPVIMDTLGCYTVNGHNSGQLQQNKQQGYRPIVPAPNQSVNVCSVEPTSDTSLTSSRSNNIPFPIIIDSFSINENFRAAVAHRSFKYKILESQRQANPATVSNLMPQQTSPPLQINRGHFPPPYVNQSGQSGYIALDNTVLMKAISLERFYSFSAPAEQQPQPPSLRPRTRCYKTTRTNFSRMSLEPICSVIHPRIDLTSQKSAAEVANQRAWVWGI